MSTVLSPGLELLQRIGGIWSDEKALVLLTAIAGQESGLSSRLQVGGPARGWFQMEQGGGVRGVLQHPLSREAAAKVCQELCVPTDEATVYEAMAWSDNLSATFARLLVWTDPADLPEVGQQNDAWDYYQRLWRPGRPRIATWADRYSDAVSAVKAAGSQA